MRICDDVVLCYEIDTWNNNCNNHDHFWLAGVTMFTKCLHLHMWNKPSIQLVFVVSLFHLFSCRCCSNYFISMKCHVHASNEWKCRMLVRSLFRWILHENPQLAVSHRCALESFCFKNCLKFSSSSRFRCLHLACLVRATIHILFACICQNQKHTHQLFRRKITFSPKQ